MLTRPVNERYYAADNTVPHITDQRLWARIPLIRGGAPGLALPRFQEPMMKVGHGGMIPAAQDPTDPSTWRVPVVFT